MINLKNVPDEMLSGVSDSCLDFVTRESNERFVVELDPSFFKSLEEADRFDSILTEQEEEDLIALERSSVSKSTGKQTTQHVNRFRKFLRDRGLCTSFETVPSEILNNYLRLFYSQLRTESGSYYAPASLLCIRAAIHRHLTSAEHNRKVNILQGEDFKRANGVLKAMVKAYLTSNQDKNKNQYECISKEDFVKLKKYFSESDSLETLQKECIFNVLYYFQLRGRENLRFLTRECIDFKKIGDREVAYIKVPLLQKNVKASLKSKEFEDLKMAMMVEQPDNIYCPVKRLHQYLNALPEQTKENTLFPKYNDKQKRFSSLQVLGKDKLGNVMADLSNESCLSRRYTNHSIRVTGINFMHDSGMSNEEISSITGHKNPKSVQHYIRKNEQKIMHASDVLSNIFHESSVEKSEASIEIKNKETIMAKVSRSAVRGCSISSRDDEDEPATKVINIYNPSNCAFNF